MPAQPSTAQPSTALPAYAPAARLMHWVTVLLVFTTIPVGMVMVQKGLPREVGNALFIYHKNVGVLLLLLVLARLAFRAGNPPPPLPASVAGWQRQVAGATHAALYALLLVMAVSGYIRVAAGGFPIEMLDALGIPKLAPRSDLLANTAKAVHFWVRFPLVALILLHVGAALMHGLVKRDGVFGRMWPGRAG